MTAGAVSGHLDDVEDLEDAVNLTLGEAMAAQAAHSDDEDAAGEQAHRAGLELLRWLGQWRDAHVEAAVEQSHLDRQPHAPSPPTDRTPTP